jgi:hypothetical protein
VTPPAFTDSAHQKEGLGRKASKATESNYGLTHAGDTLFRTASVSSPRDAVRVSVRANLASTLPHVHDYLKQLLTRVSLRFSYAPESVESRGAASAGEQDHGGASQRGQVPVLVTDAVTLIHHTGRRYPGRSTTWPSRPYRRRSPSEGHR